MYGPKYAFHGAQPVRDGQVIECAGIEVDVLQTPGHTVGGCCYYLPKEHRLFSGDTLFCASIGRTDLPKQQPAGSLCAGEDYDTSG